MQGSHHTGPRGNSEREEIEKRKRRERKRKRERGENKFCEGNLSPQTYIPRYDQLRPAASSPTDLRGGNFRNCGKERQRCQHRVEAGEHSTSPSSSEFNPHSPGEWFWGRKYWKAPALTHTDPSMGQAGAPLSTWRTSAAHRLFKHLLTTPAVFRNFQKLLNTSFTFPELTLSGFEETPKIILFQDTFQGTMSLRIPHP